MSQLNINFQLHKGQREAHLSKARYKVLGCGRRWGKTHFAWIQLLLYMLKNPSCLVWWVAPYYKELVPATRKVRELTPNSLIAKKIEQQEVIRYIRLTNGSECWFHSADREDSLRGSGLHGLVIDEAPTMRRSRWDNELRPSLTDFKGWVIFIGTPKGHNWFHEFYVKGQDKLNKDYDSWNYPTKTNPCLDHQEIEDAKKDLPELVFRQEYLAEFLEDIGAVFRNVRAHIKKIATIPQKDHRYVVGADLAKYEDFTVLTALDVASGELHGFERFSQLDWVFQRRRIVEFCKRYNNARLLIDSSGVGDPIYDELRRHKINITGYKFTSSTKADLIENLSLMLDNNQLSYPDIPELINELRIFGYKRTPAGNIQYQAPETMHDDCVISLALAAWQIRRPSKIDVGRGKVPW